MIPYRWSGRSTNFGDELNALLWPALLPGLFDGNPDARFLGIGSVLDARHPDGVRKVVAGAGYGGYEAKPVLDASWIVHWVRGPLTAGALGLPTALALGDPAILAPAALGVRRAGAGAIGFVPHFESAARGAWQRASGLAGLRLIDPRGPPMQVVQAIAACRLVLSEALHGVIVADALRVPWVAIRPIAPAHRAKWLDWSATMGLSPRFQALPASTWKERAWAGPLASFHATRRWLDGAEDWLDGLGGSALEERAAAALAAAAESDPQLSADRVLDRCGSRMLDAVDALRARPFDPAIRRPARAPLRSPGSVGGRRAYQLPVAG